MTKFQPQELTLADVKSTRRAWHQNKLAAQNPDETKGHCRYFYKGNDAVCAIGAMLKPETQLQFALRYPEGSGGISDLRGFAEAYNRETYEKLNKLQGLHDTWNGQADSMVKLGSDHMTIVYTDEAETETEFVEVEYRTAIKTHETKFLRYMLECERAHTPQASWVSVTPQAQVNENGYYMPQLITKYDIFVLRDAYLDKRLAAQNLDALCALKARTSDGTVCAYVYPTKPNVVCAVGALLTPETKIAILLDRETNDGASVMRLGYKKLVTFDHTSTRTMLGGLQARHDSFAKRVFEHSEYPDSANQAAIWQTEHEFVTELVKSICNVESPDFENMY